MKEYKPRIEFFKNKGWNLTKETCFNCYRQTIMENLEGDLLCIACGNEQ